MYYIEKVDNIRYPGIILEARCRCSDRLLLIPELLL